MSSFITTSATQDVFELVLARPVVMAAGEHDRLVHLWWRAPQQGNRLVQVYLDDQLYDVTLDAGIREVFVLMDRARPHRIELLAVDADDPEAVWRPQPQLLQSWSPKVKSTAEIGLVRDEDLPIDSQFVVLIDGEQERGMLWPGYEVRAGSNSESGPVFDEAFGSGLGIGALGAGPLGFDGNAWRWVREDLEVGDHQVQIIAEDGSGVPVSLPMDVSISIEHLPPPVVEPFIQSPAVIGWETGS